MSEKFFLNLGCGDTTPVGWINCDSSWHAQISNVPGLHRLLNVLGLVGSTHWPNNVKYLSLGRRWPWASGTVDCVYGSHVFEHLYEEDADHFMREANRVLKTGGVIRIVVPDLYYHAMKYVQAYAANESGAEEFLHTIHLRFRPEKTLLRNLYGLINGYPHLHKEMYDRHTLGEVFKRHGFTNLQSCEYGQSAYLTNVKDVEAKNNQEFQGSLYLEACKL